MALVLSQSAFAGERLIGTITSAAGADTTNASTAVPFAVPFGAKLTIVCNAAGYVITDTTTAASSTTALPLTSGEKFPTSTGSSGSAGAPTVAVSSKPSAIVRIAGAAAVACMVFTRTGQE
jgi:hypothetical protein